MKKTALNILFVSDLLPTHTHNHAYNLVAIYFEKTVNKHKWHKLYFTQLQRTDNNDPIC
jgi:hypothetical protein